MKAKQRSFISNNSNKLTTYRPHSSSKCSRYMENNMNNKNNSLSEIYPQITFTMPNQKKNSIMGKQISKEQLYEENMHLKDKLNKMRKELAETKNKLFKKGLELNKKEKIIRDCSKENVTEQIHEINLEKAKESTLLTMCKQKYIEMKNKYEKKCEENDILKANIKITKLKEYKIKIDVLKNEMEKLKNLYMTTQSNYERSLREIKKMNELKKEFNKQHSIIISLNNKYQNLSNELNYIQLENNYLKNELKKNQGILKKLRKNTFKLKISNEKYMTLKKQKENFVFLNTDNLRKLKTLQKDLDEYKLLYSKQNEKVKSLLKSKGLSSKQNDLGFKPFNYENVKNVEPNPFYNQSQLYKSLLEEAKIKNLIFENFLIEHDINPEQIIKNKGYEGILNLNTNKKIIKLTQIISKSSTNNSTNSKDATSVGTKENQDMSKNLNYTQSNLENNYLSSSNINNNILINDEINNDYESNKDINNEKNHDNNIFNDIKEVENQENQEDLKNAEIEENKEKNRNMENHESMKISQPQNSEFNNEDHQTKLLAILHTFIKNFEANHISKEFLINKLKEISLLFENKGEVTKDEFIEPFINLFIESMKVTQSSDIELIKNFFSNFINDMEGDTNRFFLELIDIFENIVDYTLVENEEEVLNAISMELQPYKEEIKLKLEKYVNNIITFDNLRNLIEELNISLTDDYTEFLIYKMKVKVPENSSILDLNFKIILDLLDKNISSSNIDNRDQKEMEEKIIKEDEEESKEDVDELNTQMSNILSQFKLILKDNNTTFEDECKDKVKTIVMKDNKKIHGINKDIFFVIIEKYNIEIEEKIKKAIIDLFKIDNDDFVKNENELILLDYDKLYSILNFDIS